MLKEDNADMELCVSNAHVKLLFSVRRGDSMRPVYASLCVAGDLNVVGLLLIWLGRRAGSVPALRVVECWAERAARTDRQIDRRLCRTIWFLKGTLRSSYLRKSLK